MEDWETSIHDWAIRSMQSQPRIREVTDDQMKISIVLLEFIRDISDKFARVNVENHDGQYVITIGEELNAVEIKVQNPLEHYRETPINEAIINMMKVNYRPHMPEYFATLAHDIINDHIEAGMIEEEDEPYTGVDKESIYQFAQFLHDSDSFTDAVWRSASSELEYYLEMQRENDEE